MRVLGDVTVGDALDVLRAVDEVFIQTIREHGLYDKIWQAFAVFLPVRCAPRPPRGRLRAARLSCMLQSAPPGRNGVRRCRAWAAPEEEDAARGLDDAPGQKTLQSLCAQRGALLLAACACGREDASKPGGGASSAPRRAGAWACRATSGRTGTWSRCAR